ncbi:hypothetical protein AB9P05_04470 [Roseivirga sp. BDSF3-8]|uniref:hypothetical protein n=1 Tax=Roseivirga sp. BDSF3-8 TaxID=3241598 RepID=UPI003531ED3F
MRYYLIILIIMLTACAFSANKPTMDSTVKLTVVKYDNQNPGFEFKTDTLINSKLFDLAKTKVDLYFSHINFRIPYYIPTNSNYKDSIKDKECNWLTYPANVKCYEYDKKGRVIKMKVEGSGTMSSYSYSYDKKDRVIKMTNNGSSNYKMIYDTNGNLIKLIIDGDLQKHLLFYYE